MRKTLNTLFCSLTSLLFALILSLNFCKKITYCSLVVVCCALVVNLIASSFGRKNAMKCVVVCIGLSFGVLSQYQYYLNGTLMTGLIFASFVSLLISSYFGLKVLTHLRNSYTFVQSNLAAMFMYAFVDSLIMASYFTNIFSINKSLSIFGFDMIYKCIYIAIICGVMMLRSRRAGVLSAGIQKN